MAHELDFSRGKAAIAYNIQEGTPWHKEGTAINGSFTIEEALDKGEMNFDVELQDLTTSSGVLAPNFKAVVRTDLNKVLGVVSNKYSVLQNRDAGSFFDHLTKDNKAIFDTAGVLNEGRTIWLLAKLEGDPIKIIADDIIEKYLLFTNNHTGLSAARARFTPIRVVCANTLGWAMNRKAREEVAVSHVGDVAERVKFAGELLATAGKFYDEMSEGYRAMARVQLNTVETIEYIKESLRPYKPKSATEEEILELQEQEEQDSRQLKNEIEVVLNLIDTGRGSSIKGVRGSLWGAYNGITEYVDHYKAVNSKLNSTAYIMQGVGKLIKKKAIKLAYDRVKSNNKNNLVTA
jgi:phage/plasmid-like protein (TIGR03299 family)